MNERSVKVALTVPPSVPARLRARLRRAARAAVAGLPRAVAKAKLRPDTTYTLAVALVSDRRMRSLNAAYRGKDRTTDVLSFSRLEGEPFPAPEAEVGDVLVSLSVARAQAKEYGAPLAEELERLVVHGVLHLFGYDHERGAKEARQMFRLQEKVLSTLKRR